MCSGLSPVMTYSPDLSKWAFNKILGLGNKEWNTKVREYRENHRTIRMIKPLQLWNIADKTKETKEIMEQQKIDEEVVRQMGYIKI